MMRRFRPMPLLALLLLLPALGVHAADIRLDAETPGTEAVWTVLEQSPDGMTLEVGFPVLGVDEVEADGRTWHLLGLEGGALLGRDGEPGLPAVGRLVDVPRGAVVTGRVIAADMVDLGTMDIMPVQPATVESFVIDQGVYGRDTWLRAGAGTHVSLLDGANDAPAAFVGRTAVVAGRSVAPLSVAPVLARPADGAVMAARRVVVELTFTGDDPVPARTAPASFDALFADVLGAPAAADKSTPAAPGTWMIFYRDDASESRLSPLIEWRRQQGYHVELRKTDVTGNTRSAIKAEIQAAYDDPSLPPLEFVVLAGDATGAYDIPTYTESLSGYGGEGDHEYACLEGDDVLADVHIGRLSFQNPSELETIVAKVVGYETAPPMGDTGWFGRAHLIGDPGQSGITTIYVNRWLRTQLQNNGWAQVDTTWSGNFPGEMMSNVSAGVSAFGYRGYYGMSGITTSYVANLSNGGMLPVAVIPTCDTGTFEGQTTCMSEAWLRSSGGAVAAVGTATIGTHTRYNNCYYHGMWDGLLNSSDHRVGAAHTLGKVELYNNYFLAEPHIVEIWSIWNNLMGDPATDMWRGVPQSPAVTVDTTIEEGSNVVPLIVEMGGVPVEGARVCVYREGEVQSAGFTAVDGSASLAVDPLTAGTLTLTVSGHGILPHQATIDVVSSSGFCSTTGWSADGDGLLSPGETVDFQVALTNHGSAATGAVTATLSGDVGATVTDGALDFGVIASGAEAWSTDTATLKLDGALADGTLLRLALFAGDVVQSWPSLLEIPVSAPAFSVTGSSWSGPGGDLDPGENGSLVVTLDNVGSLDAATTTATLTTDSPWVTITGDTASFGSVTSGATADNASAPFGLDLHAQCYPGHLATFTLTVVSNGAMVAEAQFALPIGTAISTDPTGPDTYGYFAYDDTDLDSGLAPVFDWIALDSDHDGPGTDLGLTDGGWEQDDTATIDLPFTFRYYGVDYDRISICSNGWAAMGDCSMVNYRNFSIPSKGSPPAMIAPYWDNLNQTGTHRVYTWYDADNHRFIVQWYRMPNHFSGLEQDFEMILLDPAWHGTATGDGMIVFQYQTVNNTDTRDGYGTVGLQNAERTDGLLWTYWNQYAAGAAPLVSGRAIRFVPLGQPLLPVADVTPASVAASVAEGAQTVEHLHIANAGDDGSNMQYVIDVVDPATVAAAKRDIAGSELTIAEADYLPGSTVDLSVSVSCTSPDWEWVVDVALTAPAGVTINSATSLVGGSQPLGWNGETGDGATTTWDGGHIDDGQKGDATLNVTFAPELFGDITFQWVLDGDQYGGQPHQVSGDVVLAMQGPSIAVHAPVTGDVAVIGSDVEVAFQALNGPADVDIDLQRADGGPWTSLATSVPVAGGSWMWTVAGDPGPYARIRVTDAADPATSDTSGVFAVGRPMDWVALSTTSGGVTAGQTVDVDVTLDATSLNEGVHDALIVVATNGGAPVSIPVSLTVTGATGVGDAPRATALLGNHPNPFNPSTVISFALDRRQDVRLAVYSSRGELVRTLLAGSQEAGIHHVVWDGRDGTGRSVASGAYLYRLRHADGAVSGKMVLTK